jgi:hypothetical protein
LVRCRPGWADVHRYAYGHADWDTERRDATPYGDCDADIHANRHAHADCDTHIHADGRAVRAGVAVRHADINRDTDGSL